MTLAVSFKRSLSMAGGLVLFVQVRPDWNRAAELGLTTEDLGFTVSALTDGVFVNEFFWADDKIDIYLYNQQGPGVSVDTLQDIVTYVPNYGVLPLSDIASVAETVDTSSIRRLDGRRTVTLNIIPPRSVALETGVQRVMLPSLTVMVLNWSERRKGQATRQPA